MESWEAMAHTRIALSVAMAIARALLHWICEEDKVRQGGGEGGVREFDGKHQSVRLTHWHRSFFKILQIESRRSESHSHTDIKCKMPSSRIPCIPFQYIFHGAGRAHFESSIPRDAIHYTSIISLHIVSENKTIPLLHTNILEPFCCFPPPPPVLVVHSPLWPHQGH